MAKRTGSTAGGPNGSIVDALCARCKGELAAKQDEAKPKATRSRKPKAEPKVTKVAPRKASKPKGRKLSFAELRQWATGTLVWAPKQAYALELIDALERGDEIPRPEGLPESAAEKVERKVLGKRS